MPNYAVNTDKTEEVSGSLAADFAEFQEKMTAIKTKVDNLVADGYSTPAAEQDFQPFFETFAEGFEQVNSGLEGISKYVKSVGETFQETDKTLGDGLR
ncbi:WXG100 family type VII secretion target [Nocardiopsis valliformis]|uniref:WXG100 family type VII secretion target n=1 Tax=Nocardiopsis valliformis TaxID=239974 RepID=UPI000346BD3B|nr:WXG100 family type VII secretion target [Nocardiopsis valliformis]